MEPTVVTNAVSSLVRPLPDIGHALASCISAKQTVRRPECGID